MSVVKSSSPVLVELDIESLDPHFSQTTLDGLDDLQSHAENVALRERKMIRTQRGMKQRDWDYNR